MVDQMVFDEQSSLMQLTPIEPELTKLGFFVEIDKQSITLYKEAWQENRAILPALGLLKMRTSIDKPYYLFGMELYKSQHFKDLRTAVENLIKEAKKSMR